MRSSRTALSDPGQAESTLDASARGADPAGWLTRDRTPPAAARTPDRQVQSRRAWRRRSEADRGPGTATVGVFVGVAGATPCSAEDAEPVGYRLGRWARLALTLTVAATVLILTLALVPSGAPPRMVDVTVGPGDTLWGIAAAAAPEQDPRAVVAEIERLNGLMSDTVRVGDVLRVPVSG